MKADRTRRYILEKTAPVFNKKGFDGTSLADLEKATGLTKGALYGHFRDKETLAKAVFTHSTAEVRTRIQDLLAKAPNYKGKLRSLLDFFAQYVLNPPIPGGCPLLNSAVEADDHRRAMRLRVAGEVNDMVNGIAILLRKGVRAGEFRKDTPVRRLAYVFFCSIEGAIMVSRIEGSREPMDIIVEHCKNKLDQITCNKDV